MVSSRVVSRSLENRQTCKISFSLFLFYRVGYGDNSVSNSLRRSVARDSTDDAIVTPVCCEILHCFTRFLIPKRDTVPIPLPRYDGFCIDSTSSVQTMTIIISFRDEARQRRCTPIGIESVFPVGRFPEL